MQQLWAKVLAGEANTPGTFSKRTINLLASLDKSDAERFQAVCRFNWGGLTTLAPLIFESNHEIFREQGINWDMLKHLDEIGLLSFEMGLSYGRAVPVKPLTEENWADFIYALNYGDKYCAVYCGTPDGRLNVGRVKLSRAGAEIAALCAHEPVAGYFDYVVGFWRNAGAKVILAAPTDQLSPTDFGLEFSKGEGSPKA
jgi:hypothetical protein